MVTQIGKPRFFQFLLLFAAIGVWSFVGRQFWKGGDQIPESDQGGHITTLPPTSESLDDTVIADRIRKLPYPFAPRPTGNSVDVDIPTTPPPPPETPPSQLLPILYRGFTTDRGIRMAILEDPNGITFYGISGDSIRQWKITRIETDSVYFQNGQFSASITIAP
ncbi:MAG: hypothetical protein CL946_12825 [Ectothiorhodospiraceae bacterium]|nr:hypothetical protein [Ectothiorhodospiraceae bacterium]